MRKNVVLIVDEDEVFRQVYGKSLSKAGYIVLFANGATEAIELIGKETVNLIVSEVLLPGKNGLRLVKDIRVQTASNNIPVIFLTVLEAADIGLYASLQQTLGIVGYLVKHKSTPHELTHAVNHGLATL
jgi:CheY-like chemotaxis protein